MKITEKDGGVSVAEIDFFDVAQTFDCGQCFRFEVAENGRSVSGFAFGREVRIDQLSDSEIYIYPCSGDEFQTVWVKYLGLDTDYGAVRNGMRELRPDDEKLLIAMETGKGIRILRQEPWETLCSFIISQNNNIPRIKKLISALCKAGAEIEGGSDIAFPKPETLVKMGVDGLFALKTGFRAGYLYDAALKVSTGEIDLNSVFEMSFPEAEAELCKIKGVGPKVAACTLLFGFGKLEAFPIDVWVKRVIAEYYGGAVSPSDFGNHAGLAQQYLFYHRKWNEG